MRHLIIMFLMGLIDTPYIWGGQSRKGTDCSGLVVYTAREFDLFKPDMTAQQMFDTFPEAKDPRPADLVFYSNREGKVVHVEFLIGNGLTIGANGGDSKCKTPEIAAIKDARVKVSKVHKNRIIAGYRSIPNIDKEMLTA